MGNLSLIQDHLDTLFQNQKFAVLATVQDDEPYTSLVAFATDESLKSVFFATRRSARKFKNLTRNPMVSVLIHNSTNHASDYKKAIAVTITGSATEVFETEREASIRRLLDRHPDIRGFIEKSDCAVVKIEAQSFAFVENFETLTEISV